MSEIKRINDQLKRAFEGTAWHGPSVSEVLAGVTAEQAAAHPIAGAHSIWEIVRHVAAWADIAGWRVRGEKIDPTPGEDWPPVADEGDEAWARDVERLANSYRALAEATRALDDRQLDAAAAGQEYSVAVMLHGVVEHGTYHGGQIALLKKA